MAGRGPILQPINPTYALLIARGITRLDFADMIGTHPNNLTNYATGQKPWTVDKIRKAAEILGVTPNMLRGVEPIPGLEDVEWQMWDPQPRKWNRLQAENQNRRKSKM